MPDYTILLIDYDPRSIERLRNALVKGGLRVEVAKDGLAGIKRFHELKPDLTLIEAMIPKKHGFEVCQELKKTPHGQASAVLIITSVYKGRKYRSQAMHSYRCDEYLEKPISDETLVSVIKRHLPKREDEPAPTQDPPAPAHAEDQRLGGTAPPINPLHDLSDAEVIDHLDALLPEDLAKSPENNVATSDPDAKPSHSPSLADAPRAVAADSDNVIRFDLERARARGIVDAGGPNPDRPAAGAPRYTGGPQPAFVPVPDHVERTIPPTVPQPRSSVSDTTASPVGPAPRPDSRERLYFWIALVLAAVLVAVLAMIVAF